MSIRKKDNGFLVDVKVGPKDNPTGKAIRVRVVVRDKDLAKKREVEIRAAIMKYGGWHENMANVAKPGAPKRHVVGTLRDALEEAWSYPSGKNRGWMYQKTGKVSYARAQKAIEILGEFRLCSSITSDDFDTVVQHYANQQLDTDTINLYVSPLYRLLWHAQRKGWIVNRPMWERLAQGRPREFIFSEEMEQKVYKYFAEQIRDVQMSELFTIGIETGMRLQEVLKSQARHWDLDARLVYVPHAVSKSGVGRYITLTPKAIAVMKPILENREDDFRPFPLPPNTVQIRMRMARKFFNMEGYSEFCFHATRHTRATRLARETRDPYTVMSQLGHSDIKTSMRYIKMVAMDIAPRVYSVPQ